MTATATRRDSDVTVGIGFGRFARIDGAARELADGSVHRNSARTLGIRASSAGVARASIPAEILAYARAAYPQRRSSNANSLQSQNSAGFRQICAIFQSDNLRRHF